MTNPDDPLISHLQEEAARIERSVDQRLPWPAAVVHGPVPEPEQVIRWSYRYTWQEVERGRRYVIPLPADRAVDARRAARSQLPDRNSDPALTVQQPQPRIRFRPTLNVYEISCSLMIDSQPLP